ncbi:hypothetical protein CFN78_27280 [Amycolatopsis antarctica]|uniref:Uncharacterized protein n=1 Tax=Amycolatopsis antarctica TaxID=1854586 RepID=A0A263CVN6_9PSEU|nr:hypothetical protein [Amycolatopsis antarctica]OZM70038.1 hypothetical protein CFN78_27280 [Amycolatopsis antarctica]
MTTTADITAPPEPRDRLRTARILVGYAAILGTLPYLTLKFSWLLGNGIGVVDAGFMNTPAGYALNALTAGLDLLVIVLALALTHRWGRRIPAWLMLFPIWVGTGLLSTIALAFPASSLVELFSAAPSPLDAPDLPMEPWVWVVVYLGFTWQGVTLLTAFALYARDRWAAVFTARTDGAPIDAAGRVGAALVAAVGALHLAWACGLDWGNTSVTDMTTPMRVLEVVYAVLAFAAVGGTALLARPGRRFWVPMVPAWIGAGAMFGWAGWGLLVSVANAVDGPVGLLILAAQLLGGVLVGLSLLRRAAVVQGNRGAVR